MNHMTGVPNVDPVYAAELFMFGRTPEFAPLLKLAGMKLFIF